MLAKLTLLLVALVLASVMTEAREIFGMDTVGCGYDATTDEVRFCMVEHKPATNKWTNPSDGTTFDVPANLIVQNTPSTYILNATYVFNKVEDWMTVNSRRKKSKGFFSSKSKTTVKIRGKRHLEDQLFVQSVREFTFYTLTQPPLPPPPTSAMFQRAVEALPATFTPAARGQFDAFFATFGTHYVTQADFGGLIELETFAHACLLRTHDETWISKQSSKGFGKLISYGKGKTRHDIHIDELFESVSNQFASMVGGDTFSFRPNQFDEWANTIMQLPAAINKRVEPLSQIARSRGAALDAASSDYLNRAKDEGDREAAELEKNKKDGPDPCQK